MKCIKKAGEKIRRVSDREAADNVKAGWNYCPKGEWKKQGRKHEEQTADAAPEVKKAPKKPKKPRKQKEDALPS